MIDLVLFSMRLKKARQKAGLTQRQLAVKAGCTNTTVSNFEDVECKKNPSLGVVFNLANALNVSIDWLCGTEEESQKEISTYADAETILEAVAQCGLFRIDGNTVSTQDKALIYLMKQMQVVAELKENPSGVSWIVAELFEAWSEKMQIVLSKYSVASEDDRNVLAELLEGEV